MTTQKPEALRLADGLEQFAYNLARQAAKELRRLHAESEQHMQELRSYRITVENREARIAELEKQLEAAQQAVQSVTNVHNAAVRQLRAISALAKQGGAA